MVNNVDRCGRWWREEWRCCGVVVLARRCYSRPGQLVLEGRAFGHGQGVRLPRELVPDRQHVTRGQEDVADLRGLSCRSPALLSPHTPSTPPCTPLPPPSAPVSMVVSLPLRLSCPGASVPPRHDLRTTHARHGAEGLPRVSLEAETYRTKHTRPRLTIPKKTPKLNFKRPNLTLPPPHLTHAGRV